MIFLIMGVSGSGKTTIGTLLAKRLNLPFYDADDFHPEANIVKMRGGVALVDEDRKDWLYELGQNMKEWDKNGGAVLACSALRESYRHILAPSPAPKITWIYLEGSRSLLLERLKARKGHYMPPELLDSQLEALEKPSYGLHVNIANSPDEIVEQILQKVQDMESLSEFGLIGMGVMGKSLALNMAEKGVKVSIYNRHVAGKEENVAKNIVTENPSVSDMVGFDYLPAFIESLQRPRKILLMILAGAPVDQQIEALLPLLEEGDIIIDGGNSFYKDTNRRTRFLEERGIHFVGTGISGGEEGARKGPSLMPGGSRVGYQEVGRYLELIAALDKNGNPCAAYIGPDGAGHFIKMVHNSIEYAEMQVLAEAYYFLRYCLEISPEEIARIFGDWQLNGLGSYLLEITIDILQTREGGELLLDLILDQAEQKGTGGWSVGAALEHGVPYGPLTEAVAARSLSALKKNRVEASKLYQQVTGTTQGDKAIPIKRLREAYQATRIINHEVGFQLMRQVSDDYDWQLNLSEIARIWTNGCIIRSELMEELVEIFKGEKSILTAPSIVEGMKVSQAGFSTTVATGLQHGFALPVMSSALNYFLGYITADSSANLIQAQRDYFGAHTYRRKDSPADQYFHTDWKRI